jgi:hypothetical protein
VKPLDVVGVYEVSVMFGVYPESVSRWRREGTLPVPDVVLSCGPVWRRATIVGWGNETGRTIHYE